MEKAQNVIVADGAFEWDDLGSWSALGRHLKADPEGNCAVADFVQRLQADVPPDRSMLALPYQPMFYFLCERRNPTRWNYLWPGDQTAHDHQILIAEAKRDPPAAVLITNEPGMAEYAPLILDYVHAEFWPAGKSGELTVYLPRNKLGEAVPP